MRRERTPGRPPPPPRLLLVADDASWQAREVEAAAARIAKALGCSIDVVVVGSAAKTPEAQEVDVTFSGAVATPELAAAQIQQRFSTLGIDATMHVRRGPVAQSITTLEAELRPDVLVMGSSQRSQLAFHGLGGVLDQVKNAVQASLLVVRGPGIDGIAAGIDGSKPSLEAAATAQAWARALGVPFRVLVADGVAPPAGFADGSIPVEGPPVPFLLTWSRQNPRQLLAVGARGLGNPRLLELGSVSDRLAWGAQGSVLVVRSSNPR